MAWVWLQHAWLVYSIGELVVKGVMWWRRREQS